MLSNAHRFTRIGLSLALATFGLLWGTSAWSYSHLNGYSMAELIDDHEGFSSGNGEVHLGDFELVSEAISQDLLEHYRVVPNTLGFYLYSPEYLPTDPGEIAFTYSAQASDGLEIETIRLSLSSGGESVLAYGDMVVRDTDGIVLADLNVAVGGAMYSTFRSGGNDDNYYDADTQSFQPEHSILIDELTTGGMPPSNWRTGHKFYTTVVPEPETAVMVGLGLAGLALSGNKGRH